MLQLLHVQNLKSIFLFTKCWDDWRIFNGEIECYIYQKPHTSHEGLCIRQIRFEENVARLDLTVKESSWKVKIVPALWKPETCNVIDIPHIWHLALLIGAVAKFGRDFGDLNLFSNNSHRWSNGLVAYLSDPFKYSVLSDDCPGPINEGG